MSNKDEIHKNRTECREKDLLEKLFLTDFSSIQPNIGRYDTHSLIIKGWAITLWSGLMYFIIKESVHELFIIQIVILQIFWLFDALYKFYQRRFTLRYDEIRQYFDDHNIDIKNGEIVISHNKNNKSGLKIINPREEFPLLEKADEKQALTRCILLRAVSVVYIFLISGSLYVSMVIIGFFLPILAFFIIVLSFGIYNYMCGTDKVIEDHKIWYLVYFYAALISIFTSVILFGIYFSM